MNILHLLSQNHLTGAEVYAVTLAHQQMALGHSVFQISNGFYYPSEATKTELEVETQSLRSLIKNIIWLRTYLQGKNIHVIHTHSRAAAKLAYWSTLFTKTAQVSTVHGAQHSSFSKKLHNQYGKFIFAVCENIKEHLYRDFSYNKNLIKILRNPVNPKKYYFIEKNNPSETLAETQTYKVKKLAIIGRTTGPKKQRTEQIINALASTHIEITLIGGELFDLDISPLLKTKIKEFKPSELNSEIYANFDLVIGSGRVCIESILTGVPTIAFGESIYVGLITENNFFEAIKSNFGDIDSKSKHPTLEDKKLLNDIKELESAYQKISFQHLSIFCQKEFSLTDISQKIIRFYESAYFLKNYPYWIPILMYHKIPESEIKSQHKIYVTKNNFEKHLKFFKKLGFQTLTFSDLQNYRQTKMDFKNFPKKPLILTFDDGYKDNLDHASPLLKKYDFKAQIFLLANPKVSENFWDKKTNEPAHEILSEGDRLQWKNSAFEIGSHGFLHKKITEFNTAEALVELTESKITLEKELNTSVNVYAFTYGITSEDSAALAEQAGYDYAVNTDQGGLKIEEAPFEIFRVNIFPDETIFSLFKKTSRWYRNYYYLKRKK